MAQPKSKGCQRHSYSQTSSPSQSSALSTKLSFTGSQFFNLKRLCLPSMFTPWHYTEDQQRQEIFIAFKVLKVFQGHFLIKPHPSWNLVRLYNKSIRPATSPKTSVWVNYKTLSLWQFTSTRLSVILTWVIPPALNSGYQNFSDKVHQSSQSDSLGLYTAHKCALVHTAIF